MLSFNRMLRWNPFRVICLVFMAYMSFIYLFIHPFLRFVHCQNVKIKFKLYVFAGCLAGSGSFVYVSFFVHLVFYRSHYDYYCYYERCIGISTAMELASLPDLTLLLNMHCTYCVPKKFETWWPNRAIFFFSIFAIVGVAVCAARRVLMFCWI